VANYEHIQLHGSEIDVESDSTVLPVENRELDTTARADAELQRLADAVDARQYLPSKKSLSAMEIVVDYRIVPGSVTHTVRDEDHIFDVEVPFAQEWEKKPVNAFALRDGFLGAKGWSGAFNFLRVMGPFSPVSYRIALKEFERWQEFTELILVKKNRDALSSALRNGNLSGTLGEVLKALTGLYPSSFFDGVGIREAPEKASLRVKRMKELCAWFRRPPDKACSIRWVPKNPEGWQETLELLKAGRVLLDADTRPSLEFSLPRTALKPVLVIEARCSLQAIAASIYAEYWDGVEYKKCPECGRVFPLGAGKRVGRWQEKEHCSDKCKQAGVNRNRPKNVGKKAPKRALRSKPNHKSGVARKGGKA